MSTTPTPRDTTPISDPNAPGVVRLSGRALTFARIGWGLLALAAVGVYLAVLPTLLGQFEVLDLLYTNQIAFTIAGLLLPVLSYGLAGLIFWRRSNELTAILLSVFMLLYGAVSVGTLDGFVYYNLVLRGLVDPGSGSRIVDLVSAAVVSPVMMLVLLLFPDGRFAPRWSPLLLLLCLPAAGYVLVADYSITAASPLWLILFVPRLAGLGVQAYRYRRHATPVQRQQIKWVLIGFGAFIIARIVLGLPFTVGLPQGPVGNVLAFIISPLTISLADALLPLALILAIFRYRLWDIDFFINRSLVYGGLTLLLGAVFAGGFFGLQSILRTLLGGEQVIVAVAIPAVAVTALFNPARLRLQKLVDSRLYGIKLDYRPALRPAAPAPVLIGRQLGLYEITESLGQGGMAEVYRGRHTTLGKAVAVKVLPTKLAAADSFRRRFEREAQVVSALKHPNIVQMLDYGVAEGTYYMVMEYVEGRDLGDLLRENGPLALDHARQIITDVADALEFAHAQGIVHRDVKPSNVLLDTVTATRGKRQRAVLSDFGIARITGGMTALTASGMVGTLDYIAPEQIRESRDVDGRADIYSLGVMAFQMLTGRLLFTASNPGALLIAHLQQPPPDPRSLRREIPKEASAAILTALAKSPDERFKTVGEFSRALG